MTSKANSSSGQLGKPAESPDISPETLLRCAELLAQNEIGWPDGLTNGQNQALIEEVRRIRRKNLVVCIAAQIAADIAKEMNGQAHKVSKEK